MAGTSAEGPDAADVPFTEAARQLLADARAESDRLRHEYVGTEHVVLALAGHRETAALLTRLGIDGEKLRASVDYLIQPGQAALPSGAERPFTSKTKQAFASAAEYARSLGHAGVGVEHVLVRLLRERMNVGAQVLQHHGLTVAQATTEAQQRGPRRGCVVSGDAGEVTDRDRESGTRP